MRTLRASGEAVPLATVSAADDGRGFCRAARTTIQALTVNSEWGAFAYAASRRRD
jgi:hypothetical protein